GEDKLIRIWDVASGKRLGILEGHTDRIPALAWHPDGKRIFSAGWDTTVRVWDVANCEPIILLNSHDMQVHSIALSSSGRGLAAAASSHPVHRGATDTHGTRQVIRERAGESRCRASAPASTLLAWGGLDRVIHLGDARSGGDRSEGTEPLG